MNSRKKDGDRTLAYRDWRRTFGGGLYVADIDQVEYRFVNGKAVPTVMLELTRSDGSNEPSKKYFDAILKRYNRTQGKASQRFAELLGVDCVIVLMNETLTQFWLYNLTTKQGWYRTSQQGYRNWLETKNGRQVRQETDAAHLRRISQGQITALNLRQRCNAAPLGDGIAGSPAQRRSL